MQEFVMDIKHWRTSQPFMKAAVVLVIRKEYEGGFYYAVYEDGQYDMDGYRFSREKGTDLEALGQTKFVKDGLCTCL